MLIRFKVCSVSTSCLLRPNPWSCMKHAWRSCRSTPKTAAGSGATPLQRRTSTRTCCSSWSCSQTCFPKSSLTSATQVSAACPSQVTFSLPLALKTLVFSLPAARLDDVFRNQDQGTPACNRTVSAADVVLYGVNIVLPLMTQDLLKVGTSNFYGLICSVSLGLTLALLSSSRLCVTSTTSSSPSSVRSFLKRSHSCRKTSSKASCFPWSWEWPRILHDRQCID